MSAYSAGMDSASDVDYATFNVPVIDEFRSNGGKVTGTFEGIDIALITSMGAKSGQPRVSPLVYVTDAGRLVIAATAAGSSKHPGWYFNLVANPDVMVEVGTKKYRARAIEVTGAERDRLFAKVIQQHPRLATYQSKTSRTVPVFTLQRIDDHREEPTPMSTPAQVVEQFLDHLNAQRIDDGMDLLAEDVFYHNIPMDPITGREAVRQSAHEFGMGSTLQVDWELVSLAAADDVVLTERIDIFTAADGKQISMPLMGSFRIRYGYIAEWRDYFDLAELQRQMAAMGMTEDEPSAPSN